MVFFKKFFAIHKRTPTLTLDRILLRPASHGPKQEGGALLTILPTQSAGSAIPLTAEVLDAKLQSLLQNLTHNISREMGKIAQELRELRLYS